MKLKILVTGGAGYLGSIMVPDLLAEGHEVTVVDSFLYQQASLNHCTFFPNFDVLKTDVRNQLVMEPLLKKADVIIPLAALVGAPLCAADPIGAQTTNVDAMLQMLKFISKDQLILMPTTNSAYGSGHGDNFCDETSPLQPISKYAKDKLIVEEELMGHPNAVSFRLATVFGMSPRMRLDLLVNDFVYRAVNDRFVVLFESSFKRNYIHVRDVSAVFRYALKNISSMKNQIYNVGLSDANLSKAELCVEIRKQIDSFCYFEAAVGKDPDQRNYIVSNEKLAKTGFNTKYKLAEGISELIKGFQMIRNNKYGNI